MTHDTDDSVLLDRKGRVAWVTLNRPAAMNAVSPAMLARFGAVLDEIEADAGLGAVVITGAGNAFCAGADLKALREFTEGEAGDAANADYVMRYGAAMRRLELFAKPVVVAINGVTVAGGLEMALCCDVVLAAAGARIGDGTALRFDARGRWLGAAAAPGWRGHGEIPAADRGAGAGGGTGGLWAGAAGGGTGEAGGRGAGAGADTGRAQPAGAAADEAAGG